MVVSLMRYVIFKPIFKVLPSNPAQTPIAGTSETIENFLLHSKKLILFGSGALEVVSASTSLLRILEDASTFAPKDCSRASNVGGTEKW
ncbi:hypothetical protein SDJN03_00982, partial [Cucurbita argyrosperma subsp. sororia]